MKPKGAMRLGQVEYSTYSEYLNHPKFKAIRHIVMKGAKWVCHDCKKARATQVHHLKYPPWGTFDVPENLVAICYKCHCVRHNKEE